MKSADGKRSFVKSTFAAVFDNQIKHVHKDCVSDPMDVKVPQFAAFRCHMVFASFPAPLVLCSQMWMTKADGSEHTIRSTSQVERFFKSMRTLIMGKSLSIETAHWAVMKEIHRINVRCAAACSTAG